MVYGNLLPKSATVSLQVVFFFNQLFHKLALSVKQNVFSKHGTNMTGKINSLMNIAFQGHVSVYCPTLLLKACSFYSHVMTAI